MFKGKKNKRCLSHFFHFYVRRKPSKCKIPTKKVDTNKECKNKSICKKDEKLKQKRLIENTKKEIQTQTKRDENLKTKTRRQSKTKTNKRRQLNRS